MKQHNHFVLDRAYNAFDRRFDELAQEKAARSGMRVDTLGTTRNVSVSISGRTRWSPAPTAVRMLRLAREPF